MADDSSFGAMLKAARVRAGFATQHSFADALADLGLDYSDEAIGHWEKDRRSPYSQPQDREQVLTIIKCLADRGGFEHLKQINTMLRALKRPALDDSEIDAFFSYLAAVPAWHIPNPPQYFELVGRDEALRRAIDLLMNARVPVVSIAGLGGIGKTALTHAAIRVVERTGRFERFGWQSAQQEQLIAAKIRPSGGEISLDRICRGFLGQLRPELPPSPIADPIPALRQVVQTFPCLLVLDNLETVEAAQQAVGVLANTVQGTPSRILISSREKLAALDHVSEIPLEGLTEPMTAQFVQVEARHRQLELLLKADAATLRAMHGVTGGMPLALKLVIGQFAAGIPLDIVLERVKNVVDERELYRFIYLRSWRKLSDSAKSLLIIAAGFAAPTLRRLLADASGLPQAAFFDACKELITLSLLETAPVISADQQRYGLHPMTRWFVNSPLREMIEAGATDL